MLMPMAAAAHNISGANAQFVQGLSGPAVIPYMYLGAKHMVTGYDHLLYLVGVVFFLLRLKDVIVYVSLLPWATVLPCWRVCCWSGTSMLI